MTKVTYLTVIEYSRKSDENQLRQFALTSAASNQRRELREIFDIEAFVKVEFLDYGMRVSLTDFFAAYAKAENKLLSQAALGVQFAIDLQQTVAAIRDFVKHDYAFMAFVHVA